MKRPRKIDPWDREFGYRLKVARTGAHLSAPLMAEKLKVDKSSYYKYESGERSFPKHLIAEVVRITFHGPWFLLTGEPDHRCPAYQVSDTGSFQPKHSPVE